MIKLLDVEVNCSEVFIAIASQQVSTSSDFYSKLLGINPKVSTSTYAELQVSSLRIAIFSPSQKNAVEFEGNGSGSMSLCLEVADLEAAIALLTRMGYAPPGNIIHASHGREIYAYDPDGNRLILHQSPPSDSP